MLRRPSVPMAGRNSRSTSTRDCPCAKATLVEVAALAGNRELSIRIVFVRPPGVGESWESGRLWDYAATIPGIRVTADEEGTEARTAGATTSGFAVFRDAAGGVQYRGGLTSARGRNGAIRGVPRSGRFSQGRIPPSARRRR